MGNQSNCSVVFTLFEITFLDKLMNVENVHFCGHSPVFQIATHILCILCSAVYPALNSSAGTSSRPVVCDLLSDRSHEQPLNEVVEALALNILVQFHSLPHCGTSLHNTLSTCLRQLLTGYIAGVAETFESLIWLSEKPIWTYLASSYFCYVIWPLYLLAENAITHKFQTMSPFPLLQLVCVLVQCKFVQFLRDTYLDQPLDQQECTHFSWYTS